MLVLWIDVHLMLTLLLVLNIAMKQVDYTKAFIQANLKENVYVKLQKDFIQAIQGMDWCMLKLNKRLHGLWQAALAWFKRLQDGLLQKGFQQSTIKPCFLIHMNMMFVIYVDDCLFFAKEMSLINVMIKDLQKDFVLEPEEDVTACLPWNWVLKMALFQLT